MQTPCQTGESRGADSAILPTLGGRFRFVAQIALGFHPAIDFIREFLLELGMLGLLDEVHETVRVIGDVVELFGRTVLKAIDDVFGVLITFLRFGFPR